MMSIQIHVEGVGAVAVQASGSYSTDVIDDLTTRAVIALAAATDSLMTAAGTTEVEEVPA